MLVGLLALIASYLATRADAAGLSGAVTSVPAPSNGFVQANRPTFVGTFTGTITDASTMSVTQAGKPVDCPPVITGAKISCTPSVDLVNGKTYTVSAHGIAAADHAAADAGPTDFADAHPTLSASAPGFGGSIVSGPLSATFANADSSIGISTDPAKSTFQVYDLFNGSRGNRLNGSVTYTQSSPGTVLGGGSATDTINFSGSLQPGEYEAVIHVDGTTSSGGDNPAAFDDEDFNFWVTNAPPTALHAPAVINNVNETSAQFAGEASPGLTETVTVNGKSTNVVGQEQNVSVTGSVVVPNCSSAPSCPWTAKVDVSGLNDGTLTWTAVGKDHNGNATQSANGAAVQKDTTAPTVDAVTAPSPPQGSNAVSVSATSSSADVVSYDVTITDAENNKVGPTTVGASNHNLPATSFSLQGLDDGQLTVSVVARDGAGNVSAPVTANPTKNVGLQPELTLSNVTAGGTAMSFLEASIHPIQSPTKMTLHFTEPIIASWTDNSKQPTGSGGTTYKSTMCLRDIHGNCVNATVTFPSDGHSMTANIPSRLAESSYTVTATAWPGAFCKDVSYSPTGASPDPRCLNGRFSGTVTNNGQPLTFVVDTTPPRAPTIFMPSLIDASSIHSVGVHGTGDPGSTILVKVTSSGGGGLVIANPQGQPTAVGSNGTWSFATDFIALPDGTLNVSAVASDAAGNTSAAVDPRPTPTLQARPSRVQRFRLNSRNGGATLTWTAPAATGGSPIVTYSIVRTDNSQGAQPVTTSVIPNRDSRHVYSINYALNNGKTYNFRLYASNRIGDGAAVTGTAYPRAQVGLAERISAPIITYGGSFTLTGRLAYGHTGMANQPLTVQPRFENGRYGGAWHTSTDSRGLWSLHVTKPSKDALYYVTYSGTSFFAPARHSIRGLVRVSVRITRIAARSRSHTVPVTISGSIAPSQYRRTVYIYEYASRRSRLIGHVTVSSRSTFALSHRFSRGTHYVYARFSSQNGNIGAASSKIRFTRT